VKGENKERKGEERGRVKIEKKFINKLSIVIVKSTARNI